LSKDTYDIALKYLDLARGEILEKARFTNQTLGAYLLGSSALASWFYQTIYKPAAPPLPSATDAEKAAAAVGLALMLSYLAVAVNWIIHHNERIIAALALYQRVDLYSVLGDRPPMWERSSSLEREDRLWPAALTVLIQEFIILGPPIAASIFATRQVHAAPWLARWWITGAWGANVASVIVGLFMFDTKRKLRSNKLPPSTSHRSAELPASPPANASK